MAPEYVSRRQRASWHTVTILFLLATVLGVTLSGCGGAAKETGSNAPATSTATETPTAPPHTPTARPSATGYPPVGAPSPSPSPTAAGTPTWLLADLAAGEALLQAQCASCHALASAGMSGALAPVAPPLDHVGRRRSRAWLEAELVNPCAHPHADGARYSCTAMPSFGALTQQQRNQIVLYLLSQR